MYNLVVCTPTEYPSMTTIPTASRRRVLQAMGLGATAAVAGCVGAPAATLDTNDENPTPPSMNDAKAPTLDRIAADPTDIPGPITRSEPTTVRATMTTREHVAEIEPGVTYTFMTFDDRIPGPMLRVREGDTVEFTITNDPDNEMPHNIDLHAVRGPGGGAEATMVAPGETKTFRFTATYAGLFVYHCAVPNLDYHISSGMFGAILVEPKDGLPPVDHEFYLGQHELYTTGEAGEKGHHDFDFEAMAREDPTYVLINGEKYAIGPQGYNDMRMATGETARVYYAVGGPNLFSSFHPIGSVWDEVWPQGAIESDAHRNVQTTPVLPGSTAIATLHAPVPGPIKLVDHALSRVARKGALAVIDVQGPANPEIFDPMEEATDRAGDSDGDGTAADFGGYLDDVDNVDGVVDRTGESEVTIEVGSPGNGGNFGYGPAAVKVDEGTTVTWEWVTGMHDVQAEDGSFKSTLTDDDGHTFSQPMDKAGVVKYFCQPHKAMGMKGVVVVA
jgi:nitrite reductase (NO-forming)